MIRYITLTDCSRPNQGQLTVWLDYGLKQNVYNIMPKLCLTITLVAFMWRGPAVSYAQAVP